MTPPRIEWRGARLGYGEAPVLEGVHLQVEPGQVLGLLGRSGCGKSTLLHAAAGLLELSGGELLWNGQPTRARERRGRAGFVPQRPSLLPWRTVLGNLLLPAEVRGDSIQHARQQALQLLERFGLAETATRWPYQLSGGMAQRIAVLRAALLSPDALLLDEPFSALDALTRLKFQDWLREFQREWQPTVLLVTHDVREALSLCDEVAVLAGHPANIVLRRVVPPASNSLARLALEDELLAALLQRGVA